MSDRAPVGLALFLVHCYGILGDLPAVSLTATMRGNLIRDKERSERALRPRTRRVPILASDVTGSRPLAPPRVDSEG